jgi:PAT family beta-lactamase induction signal transducer AmpG
VSTAIAPRPPHPFAYTVLIVPFGAIGGYVSVAMVFLATRYGLTVEDGAMLVAAGIFPHVWKFLWAPITDTTLTRKTWYLISAVLCAIGIVAMSVIPLGQSTLRLLQVVIFVTNLATTFLGMAVEGLMAHATPEDQRGRVGGWFQAGNLGGNGLGGGAGLWMLTHMPAPWMSGAVLGLAFLAGTFALTFVPEAPAERRVGSLFGTIVGVVRELWEMISSRRGILCAVLCVIPIGTGAATSVLAQDEIASLWHVGADTVALVNGALNGVISAIGCLAGGELCARFSSRRVYVAVGALMALVAVTMAIMPFTPGNFIGFNLGYAFVTGLAYASFTGFVLEAVGKGAAATKYTALASLSNSPIAYMGLVLAASYARFAESGGGEHGARFMLYTEAIFGVLGIVVLAIVVAIVRPRRSASAA